MLMAVRFVTDSADEERHEPGTRRLGGPAPGRAAGGGRVITTVEYLIDPLRAEAFVRMMQDTRRARLSQGAIGWELLNDTNEPGRFVEEIIDESWTEHLRRFHRATAADIALRERRLAFHQRDEPPQITRYVVRR